MEAELERAKNVIRKLVEALKAHESHAYCEMGLDADDQTLIAQAEALI